MNPAPSDNRINGSILVINGGSSSVKFALFRAGRPPLRLLFGSIERIGLPDAELIVTDGMGKARFKEAVRVGEAGALAELMIASLQRNAKAEPLAAIGHRVVHGGETYSGPERITAEVLKELRRLSPYDPEHLPAELNLIEALGNRYPDLPQVACFDTAFHRDLPSVARLLPIPRRYAAAGVRRFGFHGLSYAYLMKELARIGEPGEAEGRVILAHLGNGASMAAVHGGKSLDTTMGFTPASGLPMSTRSGDLDPGIATYLARTDGTTTEQFHAMVNKESGLLGLSETSSDMRDLLARRDHDPRAADAVALFCYQAKKCIGAYAAALGGVTTLVFSGGIGERSPVIRATICDGLEFLGIVLDPARNEAHAPIISNEGRPVRVRVMPTDEESEIAWSVQQVMRGGGGAGESP